MSAVRRSPTPAEEGRISPRCTLCASRDTHPRFRKKSHGYYRCAACGHVFVWPQPSEAENAEHYRLASTPEYLRSIRLWFEVLARRRVALLEQLDAGLPGRLLDLGAGQGFFVKEACEHGWEAEGIESSPEAVRFGLTDLGVRLQDVDLADGLEQQPPDSWDVVTLWHCLEHTENPGWVLRESRRILRPGGMLILNSPNLASAVYRIARRHWSWIYCPGHLQYFSTERLSQWLQREGFTVVREETWTDAPSLYFMLEEALVLWGADLLMDRGVLGLGRIGRRISSFVYQPFHQQVVQKYLNWFYRRTPGLDACLRRRGLGHEFYIVARVNDV